MFARVLRRPLISGVHQRMFNTLDKGGELGTFSWRKASHNGVRIVVNSDPVKEDEFLSELVQCLRRWKKEGRKAVWLPLDVDQIELSKPAIKAGFEFHNAKGNRSELVQWLPDDIPNKVPHFGFHQVGVGGLVFNSRNQILLVKERLRRGQSKIDRWKMPGGLVDPGETLGEAVAREVWEETGVTAEFCSLLGFWQRTLDDHQSDMYFVCRLTSNQERIDVDPVEISEGTWLPIEDYFSLEKQHPMILTVLKNCFHVESKRDVEISISEHGYLKPRIELGLTELDVNPSLDPFDTYVPSS